jgi:hypothetical protein
VGGEGGWGDRARVALLIQHAMRMRHIVVPLAAPYFSTLSHKQHDFQEKGMEHFFFYFVFNLGLKRFSL